MYIYLYLYLCNECIEIMRNTKKRIYIYIYLYLYIYIYTYIQVYKKCRNMQMRYFTLFAKNLQSLRGIILNLFFTKIYMNILFFVIDQKFIASITMYKK